LKCCNAAWAQQFSPDWQFHAFVDAVKTSPSSCDRLGR
jgi:hypothetical protein